jgi:ATP-binding cassette subfamily B protein
VLIAIPVIVLPLVAYGRAVRALSREAQDTLAHASAYASESLGQLRVLQAFTQEGAVTKRFSESVERSFAAADARAKARAGLTGIAIFLVVASVVGVLWYGAQDVLSGNMTAGRLGQFVLYAVLAAAAVGELSEVWGEVSAAGAAERLAELPRSRRRSNRPPIPRSCRCTARRDRVQDVVFLSARPETRAERRELRRGEWREGRDRGTVGRRQDHHLCAVASLLRCELR